MDTAVSSRAARTSGLTSQSEALPLAVIVILSGVFGAYSGAHPTASPIVDHLYTGVLAALLAAAGSRASRGALLLSSVVAVAMSRGWLYLPAAGALGLAFSSALSKRALPLVGALSGALVAQIMLRWPPVAFLGATAAVGGAITAVLLVSAWRTLSAPLQRRTATVTAGLLVVAGLASALTVLASLSAKRSVDTGTAAARTALHDIDAGQAPEAVQSLHQASSQLAEAHRRASQWWAAAGQLVPIVAQQRRAVLDVTRVGRDLTASAAGEAGTIDFRKLVYKNGGIDLAAVRRLATPVERLDTQIRQADRVVVSTDSPWLVGPLRTRLEALGRELARARSTADLAQEGVSEAPTLLGGSGPRTYFVAFMSPAEARGLGGFIGAYAIVRAVNGHLSVTQSGRAEQLSPPPGSPPVLLDAPVDYEQRYGAFDPQYHLQDLTYSPDFPTVARVISSLYPKMQGGTHVDGVLAIDPYALQSLLSFTGPISVPGIPQPLTETNAAAILLRQQYLASSSNSYQDARHSVLQQALTVGFQKLTAGSLPEPKALATTLGPMVRQGRLLFWSPDQSAQPLLAHLGIEGAFPRSGRSSDTLAVTLANYDNNKIDAYMNERLDDRVSYDPRTGRVEEDVTVTLTNTAPDAGLPAYVIGSFPGSGVPTGTAREWVSLYTPFHVLSARVDGKPFALSGPMPEAGIAAYSGYVSIPAGGSTVLSVKLQGVLQEGPSFRQTIRLQPLANPVSAKMTLTLPGTGDQPSTWDLGPDSVQSHAWRVNHS